MASTTNALILGNGGDAEIYDPTSNIADEYDSTGLRDAKVDNTDSPKSFYVVYDQKNYGIDSPATVKAALVPRDPLSGSDETVTIKFDAASAQGYDLRSPGIILFESPNYIGNSKQFRASKKNVTSSFPPGGPDGVSSVIVTGGKWKLYSGKNMKGRMIAEVTAGPHSFTGGDSVKSIERVSI